MPKISGSFDVKMIPQSPFQEIEGLALARFALEKRYHGPLDASARGEMLTVAAEANGARAYVAIERVSGTLAGKRGSFALLHRGTMTERGQELLLVVAPGSGTGALKGLAGSMQIHIADKAHTYEFDYKLG